ncbi:MAG: hypothetical protein KatS3mg105_4693 [Gemmatales bacterium]|nr:MAG: hypothetical protein KatS3mg105_4693 [Gemmatales bacterium]
MSARRGDRQLTVFPASVVVSARRADRQLTVFPASVVVSAGRANRQLTVFLGWHALSEAKGVARLSKRRPDQTSGNTSAQSHAWRPWRFWCGVGHSANGQFRRRRGPVAKATASSMSLAASVSFTTPWDAWRRRSSGAGTFPTIRSVHRRLGHKSKFPTSPLKKCV